MSVKICGHEVRFQKPIKVYTLTKGALWLMVLSVCFAAPVLAAEVRDSKPIKMASSGGADPCSYIPMSRMDERRTIAYDIPDRTQRTAGSTLSPAMALALALGYRNISGPMERSAPPRAVRKE